MSAPSLCTQDAVTASLLLGLLYVASTAGQITTQGENAVVQLSAWCHGLVRVEGIRVCSDHWDHTHTQIVCQQKSCGDAVGFQQRGATWSQVYHVRCNGSESKLGQCEREWGKCDGGLVSVNCTGRAIGVATWSQIVYNCSLYTIDDMPVCSDPWNEHIPNFRNSRDRCSGNLNIGWKGRQLSVCGEVLKDRDVRNAICRELECGETGEYLEHFGPLPQNPEMVTRLSCPANRSLQGCTRKSWSFGQCSLGGLRCYDWQKISLQYPGYRYIDPGRNWDRITTGIVIVDSVVGPRMVSDHGWTEEEGEKLCQHLNLGAYESHAASPELPTPTPMWGRSFNCSGVKEPKTIWDCERDEKPTGNRGVHLQCRESAATLSGNCSGEVTIDDKLVFSDEWTKYHPQQFCQQLRCGNALHYEIRHSPSAVDAYQKRCHGYYPECEKVLGHGVGQMMSVYCRDSVKFNTTEKCGGTLMILYGNKWQQVCPLHLSLTYKHLVCKALPGECGDAIDHIERDPEEWEKNMEISLICDEYQSDARDCASKTPCKYELPAQIYCQGYRPPLSTTAVTILLIAIVLVVVTVLVILFLCLRTHRTLCRRNITSQEGKDEDEEVGDTANEMNNLKSE